jgi:hypothetical protein
MRTNETSAGHDINAAAPPAIGQFAVVQKVTQGAHM